MSQADQAQADLETTQTGEELKTAATHDPIDGATNLAEYNSLLEDQLKPQADAADEEIDPEDEEPEAGNGEETETTEEQDDSTDAEQVAVEDPELAAVEDEETDEVKSQERFRIRAIDEVEATALALKKQNPKWSLTDCLEKSKVIHNAPDTVAVTAETSGPKNVAEAKTSIIEMRKAKAEAMESLEFAEAARLDAEIDEMRDLIDTLREKESRTSQLEMAAEEIAFNEDVTKAKVKAVDYYPDAGKSDSPLVKRMQEIDERLKDSDNPLHFSPDKPWRLAQMAANELGIAPRNPKASATPAKSTPATRRPVQPASGNARTTAPASQIDKLDQAVADVADEASYEKLLAQVSS